MGTLSSITATGECHTVYAVACDGERPAFSVACGAMGVVGDEDRRFLGLDLGIFSYPGLAALYRCAGRAQMPGALWFPGAELNFAEHIFRNATPERPALLFRSERHALVEVSWEELSQKVGAIANALRAAGVERGDRVVA